MVSVTKCVQFTDRVCPVAHAVAFVTILYGLKLQQQQQRTTPTVVIKCRLLNMLTIQLRFICA